MGAFQAGAFAWGASRHGLTPVDFTHAGEIKEAGPRSVWSGWEMGHSTNLAAPVRVRRHVSSFPPNLGPKLGSDVV